jgi:precorrin-6B methylase 2
VRGSAAGAKAVRALLFDVGDGGATVAVAHDRHCRGARAQAVWRCARR